ncbi:MAG: hypothetical protein FD143_3390 [Ignavibacteria bacterium]|nr:MAG: hypothetical protein FD143_3390 [Ignavibacteria bacterium]
MDTTLKKLKLVNEQELTRLIEKQIRQYDPGLKVLANIQHEMDTVMEREDLLPEEKLALYKSAQLRFAKIKPILFSNNSSIDHLPTPPNGLDHADPIGPLVAHADPMAAPPHVDQGVPIAAHVDEMQNVAGTTPSLQPLDDEYEDAKETDEKVKQEATLEIAVDPKYSDKLARLTSLLSQNSSLISHDPANGEMKIKGQNIKNSKYGDLVRSLFHSSKNHNLKGQDKFFTALKEVFSGNTQHTPSDLIVKKEYLSHFPLPSSSSSSVEPTTSTSSTSTRHASSQLQHGKGRRIVSHPFSSTTFRPPGKKLKLLKCYT